MNKKYLVILTVCTAILLSTSLAGALPAEEDFSVRNGFPDPAPGSYGVVGTALPDGRYVVWNGDTVYIQAAPGNAALNAVASGYIGDPGFATLSPDGHTILLGAGYGDGTNANLYIFDTDSPINFQPGSQFVTQSHFSGIYLTSTLVLMDKGKSDFTGAELFVADLTSRRRSSGEIPAVNVMSIPILNSRTLVLEKPVSSYSSNVCMSSDGTTIYIMDGNSLELRSFTTANLINAFNTTTPLDWTTDGTAIGSPGTYFSGGVAGATSSGTLVIPGSLGFLQPGGVQYVNASTGAIIDTIDPEGTQPFFSAIYNPTTEDLILRSSNSGITYSTELGLPSLPVTSSMIIVLLVISMAWTTKKRLL